MCRVLRDALLLNFYYPVNALKQKLVRSYYSMR